MRRLATVGLAVLIIAAGAGIGAYMALRPRPDAGAQMPAGMAAAAPSVPGVQGAPVPPAVSNATTDQAAAPAAVAAAPPAAKPAAVPAAPPPGAPSRASAAASAPTARPAVRAAPATRRSRPDAAAPPGDATPAAGPPLDASVLASPEFAPPPAPALPPVQEPPAPPQQPPPSPPRTFEELVVSADSVLGLQIDSTVSSEVARVEDPVEAHVTRDVRVGDAVAIPSGTRVIGSVIAVERGGKMRTSPKVGVRFHTLVLADGTRLSVSTEAVSREGGSPGQDGAAKVGGAAIGGAIIGALLGGGKGAALGGAIGAAGGTAAVMAGGREPAVIASGTVVTVRLRQPVTVVIER